MEEWGTESHAQGHMVRTRATFTLYFSIMLTCVHCYLQQTAELIFFMLHSILGHICLLCVHLIIKLKARFRQTLRKMQPFVYLHAVGTPSNILFELFRKILQKMDCVSVHLHPPVSIVWATKKYLSPKGWTTAVRCAHLMAKPLSGVFPELSLHRI